MKRSKISLTLAVVFACAAITFSLTVRAQAQTLTYLATFNGVDGTGPSAPVVQATDGNFYGTTASGGPFSFGAGTFFRMTPDGNLTDIYNFCSQSNCADGASPASAPILGRDGNFYGVTLDGGTSAGGSGTVYKMTLDGDITTLHTFCATSCTDGVGPTGLVLAADGNFYGTTSLAPNSNGGYGGTIFSISPTGEFKLLYTFCSLANCMDGDFSFYPPIIGSDGNFYGVTYGGGNQGGGILWELTSSGLYKVLYNFCPESGTCPNESPFMIVRDSNGNFFGTTQYGSAVGSTGTVFELTSKGKLHVLHNFGYYTEPSWPFTGLTLANDGNVYGVTGGAINNAGSLFEITATGNYKRLYSFVHRNDGALPVGPLFQGTDGSLYGTTPYGPHNTSGSVFKFSNSLTPLVHTAPGIGKVGQHVLILGTDLTGTTSVTFNGVPAEFKVEKDTFIRATVPAGATTGIVSVVTPSGTLNSNPQFVVTK